MAARLGVVIFVQDSFPGLADDAAGVVEEGGGDRFVAQRARGVAVQIGHAHAGGGDAQGVAHPQRVDGHLAQMIGGGMPGFIIQNPPLLIGAGEQVDDAGHEDAPFLGEEAQLALHPRGAGELGIDRQLPQALQAGAQAEAFRSPADAPRSAATLG